LRWEENPGLTEIEREGEVGHSSVDLGPRTVRLWLVRSFFGEGCGYVVAW